jgi:hypothetical protein
MRDQTHRALSAAVARILHPLVRLLLRNGMPFGMFSDLAKSVYISVADQEFRLPGRKQTNSRISVLTGLSRKEVLRVKRLPRTSDSDATERYCRATRLISGWLHDREFNAAPGQPAALPMEGERGSFSALVHRHGGDIPPRALLDELLRVGALSRRDDGTVELLTRAYIPKAGNVDKLAILGSDVSALIDTIDHNLDDNALPPRFQRKVSLDHMPVAALPALQQLAGRHAQALLEELDAWMAQHAKEAADCSDDTPCKHAGVGIYYFESESPKED